MENLENCYKNIFTEIKENINDFETLQIGTRIIEIARDRLSNDLDNKEILEEYNKLNDIIKELKKIIENYV